MPRGASQGSQGDHESSDELREPTQTAGDTARENGTPGGSAESRGAWWQRLVEFAAVIAVPPALFYILGLGALWVQLSSDEYDRPSNDNAWFAASLVARPTVAGLGAEVTLRGLAASSVIATVVLIVAYIVLRLLRTGGSESGVFKLLPLLLPFSTGPLGLLLFFVLTLPAEDGVPLVPKFRIVGGLAVLYVLVFFLDWSLGAEYRSVLRRAFAFYPRWLYSAIAILSVLCVGGSVLFPGEARLPCLYRVTSEGDVMDGEAISGQRAEALGDLRTLEGGFLGHSEGHWYVIEEEQLDLEAIPDDGASRILEGEFYVAYTKIGPDGRPVGIPVAEEDRMPEELYTLSGDCT